MPHAAAFTMTLPPNEPHDEATNPSIFLRLRVSDPVPREMAWDEFSNRYATVIRGFARRIGARHQDVDDVLQDVMLGFFTKSPTFVYDPTKGKFRSYLKTCAIRALRKRLGREARVAGKPLDQIDEDEMSIEQVWNDVWEHEQLRRALDEIRVTMGQTKAFVAFERYVIWQHDAHDVAKKLDMHVNSVYRAKEQITKLLHEKLVVIQDED